MPASASRIPVFDGHNDTLLRLMEDDTGEAFARFFDGGAGGHIDAALAREGGLIGGLFAMFPPSRDSVSLSQSMVEPPYALPLPSPLVQAEAVEPMARMASLLFRLAAASNGAWRVCRSVAEIEAANAAGAFAAVLHIEGAEAIDADLTMLDLFHAAGLRSIGPVWSRPNVFGHGVPMRFPSSPDTGPGLSDAGKRLVKRCNELRILVDLSHLNEKGFDDVAALSDAPLVATHCNAHAVTPHSRNLTDRQLAVIRDSGGLVGLNFATAFLRPDGRMDAETGLDIMVRHLDHLLEHLGEDSVGLGSDFDGATIPAAIGSAAGLPKLLDAMEGAGYGRDLIERIAWRNWHSVLRRIWGG
ncbi:dipeptidase [Aureimonas psammosilenae]|uniref:dipeptidase n=1 Tax=Aureimonas psammosilenae TaxID=2495496 RepID=UPI0022A674DA|nr:dipeptidase [Aureimonas psammosilenae]